MVVQDWVPFKQARTKKNGALQSKKPLLRFPLSKKHSNRKGALEKNQLMRRIASTLFRVVCFHLSPGGLRGSQFQGQETNKQMLHQRQVSGLGFPVERIE